DQRDESVAERFQLLAEMRPEVPDQDAKRDRDEHLNVENLVPGLMTPDGGADRFCCHCSARGRLEAWFHHDRGPRRRPRNLLHSPPPRNHMPALRRRGEASVTITQRSRPR